MVEEEEEEEEEEEGERLEGRKRRRRKIKWTGEKSFSYRSWHNYILQAIY